MKDQTRSLMNHVKEIARIDLRALALYRIGLGLVLLFDFIWKSADLTAFYTDQGIMPRALVVQNGNWWNFSLHLASGSFGFQAALMGVGIALSIALIFGYFTRVVTVLLWVFVLSLQERNSLILHAGDALIRVMLFWSMFVPLNARYSLDQKLSTKLAPLRAQGYVQNLASFALLFQLLLVYMATAILKNHPEWNRDYLAVYYALSLQQFTTPLGQAMLHFPGLLKALTFLTYYLELIGPYLLITPFVQKGARWIVPFLFMGLHVSFFLTMYLGLFPWICLVGWILFLPGPLFDWWESLVRLVRVEKVPLAIRTHARIQPARWATNAIVFICLTVSLIWNFQTLQKQPFQAPSWVRAIALPLRLDQNWNMFAPYPLRTDGWFVIEGRLNNGQEFDPWNRKKPDWSLPQSFIKNLRSTPWRKYLTNVWVIGRSASDDQLAFGRYICREWNRLSGPRSPDQQLATFQLFYMRKKTPPPGELSVFKRSLLWSHRCSGALAPSVASNGSSHFQRRTQKMAKPSQSRTRPDQRIL